MVKKGDIIGYKNSNLLKNVVLKNVLEMIADKGFVEVVPKIRNVDKIAMPLNSDDIALEYIGSIFGKDVKDLSKLHPIDKKTIKPLYFILNKEIELYAKLRKLKFKKQKNKENKLKDFLDSLEKKHPEIKQSIISSYLKLFS